MSLNVCKQTFRISRAHFSKSKRCFNVKFSTLFSYEKYLSPKTFSVPLRKLFTFAFQVPRECSSWAFRNGAVQMLFLTPTRNMFPGKFVRWIRFLPVLREYICYNVERGEVRKMSDLFSQFLLALRVSARKPEIKR